MKNYSLFIVPLMIVVIALSFVIVSHLKVLNASHALSGPLAANGFSALELADLIN